MMSKNLYWAKWMENAKRRAWTFVLCFVALFFTVPVGQMIFLNRMRSVIDEAVLNGTSTARIADMTERMRTIFAEGAGFSANFVWIAAIFAVLFAVQGFSFLYDKRKMDLYMSVPVSGPKRFWMIWGNGITVFGICYLINLLLCWCVGAVFGVMTAELMADSLLAFLVNMLAFTAMYQIALLAVMLTGNVLTALLGCSVLYFYEYALRLLIVGMKSTFFVSYCNADESRSMARPWITPLIGYLDFTDKVLYENGVIAGYSGVENWCGKLMEEVLILLLAAAVSGGLVYLMFRKRKTESYHQAIAFPLMKPVLEFVMLVPFSVGVGVLVGRSAGNQNFFLFAGAVIAALIGHAVISLIYERELKAVVQRKGLAAAGMGTAAVILCIFRFDLAGYDSYVPEREKIDSVCITLEHDYDNFGRENLSSAPGGYNGAYADLLEGMNSRETATIDAVISMVAAWQQAGRYDMSDDSFEGPDGQSQELFNTNCYVVRYNLKNGRSIYRRFYADSDRVADAVNTVMQDPSYRRIRYQIYSEEFEQALDKMKIVYDDGKQELLYTLDMKELLETYREDFEAYDYDLLSGSLPCGRLIFTLPAESGSYNRQWNYPVYAGFAGTNALLIKNGISAGEWESVLAAQDVREIRVSYYVHNGEERENLLFEDGEVPEQTITCTFDDPEEIREILKALYPQQLVDVAGQEFKRVDVDYWYSVSLSLTEEAERKRYDVSGLEFLGGKTPDFVSRRIREAAVRD